MNLPANAGDIRDMSLIPEAGRSPGEGMATLLLQYFLPGESHEQSLAGNSPLGRRVGQDRRDLSQQEKKN